MTTLYDAYGRPVKPDDLRRELAAPTISGIRTLWHETQAGGLTPQRLATIIRAANENDITAQLTLSEEMEERELHYFSVLSTRKLAVSGLDIAVHAASDSANDKKIAGAVEELVAQEAFEDLVDNGLDALGKGFSVSEIDWDKSGREWFPKSYTWRDPRFFRFDIDHGLELMLLDQADLARGIPLAPFKFVVHRAKLKMGHTIRAGLSRIVALAYMAKSYTLKDWLAFAEVFGMPIRVGKHPPGAQKDEVDKLINAVANIGSDAAAVIPTTMMIDFLQGHRSSGGETLFQGLADYLDKQVSKAVIGQTMTSDDGSSLSQAEVHNDVRKDLVRSDAKRLSRTINRDAVRSFVALNFGEQARYPKVKIYLKESEDLQKFANAASVFIDRGMRVEESVVRDKFGLPEPAEGAPVLGKPQTAPEASAAQPGASQDNDDAVTDAALNRAHARALNARQQLGEIEKIARKPLSEWEAIMGPMIRPVVELAKNTAEYDEFLEKLDDVLVDANGSAMLRRLAIALFKARGLGDASDAV